MNELQTLQDQSLHPVDCDRALLPREARSDLDDEEEKPFSIGVGILGPHKPLGATIDSAINDTYAKWPLGRFDPISKKMADCDDSILLLFDFSNPKIPLARIKGTSWAPQVSQYHICSIPRFSWSSG
eukprot:Gregarina_sp_Poly_1__324@NODE_1079_length_5165_cov_34_784033_g750_i0_p6_GENE_NODE_1079_length_5165_cov_34_784033_g750_i0NODE_1079_length_5165_cov_34_784033_g750_i0_p6_ORF_typecomplete_len127_score15_07Peptidase_S68/PF10461_9/0_14_NODE_1079_length_5165_cov_34_784033_g750_i041254505